VYLEVARVRARTFASLSLFLELLAQRIAAIVYFIIVDTEWG
jgi:hypothetical protein